MAHVFVRSSQGQVENLRSNPPASGSRCAPRVLWAHLDCCPLHQRLSAKLGVCRFPLCSNLTSFRVSLGGSVKPLGREKKWAKYKLILQNWVENVANVAAVPD